MTLDFSNFKILDDEKPYVQDPIIRPKHKKSFSSDNFNFNNNTTSNSNDNQGRKYYNLFKNLQAPKDFQFSLYTSEKSKEN